MREFFRAAVQPRMLGVFALLVIGALVCVRLGAWQIDRALESAAQDEAVEQAARLGSDPVPLTDVVAPQTGFTQSMVGTRIEATGQWQPELTYWVPDANLNGESGYLLLTAFMEDSTDALLPVVRGWVPDRDDGYLSLPTGQVEIIGYLDGSQASEQGIGPDIDELGEINAGALVNVWGGPIYSGYVTLSEAAPSIGSPGAAVDGGLPSLQAMPPALLETGGLNLRNVLYAIEWFVFGGFAIALWIRLVRDEVSVRGEAAAGPGQEGDPGSAAPTAVSAVG